MIECPKCKSADVTKNEAGTMAHCFNCDKYFQIKKTGEQAMGMRGTVKNPTALDALVREVSDEFNLSKKDSRSLVLRAIGKQEIKEKIKKSLEFARLD